YSAHSNVLYFPTRRSSDLKNFKIDDTASGFVSLYHLFDKSLPSTDIKSKSIICSFSVSFSSTPWSDPSPAFSNRNNYFCSFFTYPCISTISYYITLCPVD